MIIQLCPPPKYTYPPIHFRKIEMTTKILQVLPDSPPPTVHGGDAMYQHIDDFGVSDATDEISVWGCKLEFGPT